MKVVSASRSVKLSPRDESPDRTESRRQSNLWRLKMPTSIDKELPKGTLLCIDDDEAVLKCEKAFLENFGYTVVTASSGREGLALAALHSFDVVIVDYCMPEMNGQEFATAIRRFWPRAPIIMLSGMVDVAGQALEVVDAFVPKDCLATQLVPAIALLREKHLVRSKHLIEGAIGA
jgi:CheY-like chemotaxis protein